LTILNELKMMKREVNDDMIRRREYDFLTWKSPPELR